VQHVTLVVPCYNEAKRIRSTDFEAAVRAFASLRLVLVDDGSRDGTREVLQNLAGRCGPRATVMGLSRNMGKAEAVRAGLLRGLEERPEYIGYWDADLATPFEALPDFLRVFQLRPATEIVVGSRVRLLGRAIQRSQRRHYTGRVFATAASIVLGIPVYDTQCGAKLFKNTARLHRILASPFRTRWIFDVELLGRYLDDQADEADPVTLADTRIYELALRSWIDEPGSKVRAKDGIRAAADLFRIYRLRRRRAAAPAAVPSTSSYTR
jgi:glycosyltransferase involved in cell wall biosynthesis